MHHFLDADKDGIPGVRQRTAGLILAGSLPLNTLRERTTEHSQPVSVLSVSERERCHL